MILIYHSSVSIRFTPPVHNDSIYTVAVELNLYLYLFYSLLLHVTPFSGIGTHIHRLYVRLNPLQSPSYARLFKIHVPGTQNTFTAFILSSSTPYIFFLGLEHIYTHTHLADPLIRFLFYSVPPFSAIGTFIHTLYVHLNPLQSSSYVRLLQNVHSRYTETFYCIYSILFLYTTPFSRTGTHIHTCFFHLLISLHFSLFFLVPFFLISVIHTH